MKNLQKNIIFLILAILLMFSITPAFAATIDTSLIQEQEENTVPSNNTSTPTLDTENPGGLPQASIEEVETKIESKMFSIVGLLQKIGKPFFIICFIISTIVMFIGLFARTGVWKGFIGMILSGILYACVMYAPEIVEWIQVWFAS